MALDNSKNADAFFPYPGSDESETFVRIRTVPGNREEEKISIRKSSSPDIHKP